jgi:hypothetical protein
MENPFFYSVMQKVELLMQQMPFNGQTGPLPIEWPKYWQIKSNPLFYFQGRRMKGEEYFDLPTFLRRGKSVNSLQMESSDGFQRPMELGDGSSDSAQ